MLAFVFIVMIIWLHWLRSFIPQIGWDFLESIGIYNTIILTIIIPYMILIMLSIYLLFFAYQFSLLQNIAMIFISFLLLIISIALIWKRADMSPFQFVKHSTNPFNSFNKDGTH
jgi:hypothetical protein